MFVTLTVRLEQISSWHVQKGRHVLLQGRSRFESAIEFGKCAMGSTNGNAAQKNVHENVVQLQLDLTAFLETGLSNENTRRIDGTGVVGNGPHGQFHVVAERGRGKPQDASFLADRLDH